MIWSGHQPEMLGIRILGSTEECLACSLRLKYLNLFYIFRKISLLNTSRGAQCREASRDSRLSSERNIIMLALKCLGVNSRDYQW